MNTNKNFYKNHESHQLSFKRSHFVLLMCIGLIAIVAFTMINIHFASAEISEKMLHEASEYPVETANYTDNLHCNYGGCHDQTPEPWINVIKTDETPSSVTYTVDGQTDTWPGIEGWAVLDDLENNLENGFGPGEFTLQKGENEETYRVFWVDSNDSLFGEGGTNFTDITINASTNTAPSAPDITGPTSGWVGTSYNYQFVSTDDGGDKIFYRIINWGDGNDDDWFGPHPSGEAQTKSHIWSGPGNYTIEAQARDTNGNESDWGTLTVEISTKPEEPDLKIRLKMISIGKVSATIENKGTVSLSDIGWHITVEGGLFRLTKRINLNENGIIPPLIGGGKMEVCTPDKSIILRFCIARVTVTATIGDQEFNHEQYVLVVGRLIFARPLILGS